MVAHVKKNIFHDYGIKKRQMSEKILITPIGVIRNHEIWHFDGSEKIKIRDPIFFFYFSMIHHFDEIHFFFYEKFIKSF